MTIPAQIRDYLDHVSEPKRSEMLELHRILLGLMPNCRLWFLDGKNEEGKTVCNPNIGYGFQDLKYADGSRKNFYQIGISSTSTGISVYILGIGDKKSLAAKFQEKLGKARITGYCIKFKNLKDINLDVLKLAIQFGIAQTSLGP